MNNLVFQPVPLLVIMAYCHKDWQLAIKNLKWQAELDGCNEHNPILLIASHPNTGDQNKAVVEAAKQAYKNVTLSRQLNPNEEGWPKSATALFHAACEYVSKNHKGSFLWLEPDAIPLKPGWLKSIEGEYASCGKPFMGTRHELPRPHLTGVAVYPKDTLRIANRVFNGPAWDVSGGETVLKSAHLSKLFQHVWSYEGSNVDSPAPTFPNDHSLHKVNPDAVINHRKFSIPRWIPEN